LGIAVGVLLWKVSIIHSVGGVVLLIAVGVLLWKVSIIHSVGATPHHRHYVLY
jgi:hypothetical protein